MSSNASKEGYIKHEAIINPLFNNILNKFQGLNNINKQS
jgi:hypothetical protein